MTSSAHVRGRRALAAVLVAAGVVGSGVVAAGAAPPGASPSPPAPSPAAAPAEDQPEHPAAAKAERAAAKAERKAERAAAKAERKAERTPGPGGPAEALEGRRSPTGPAFVCDPSLSHGQNVSAYARSLPKGPGRGRLVSRAARSDCGKPSAGD